MYCIKLIENYNAEDSIPSTQKQLTYGLLDKFCMANSTNKGFLAVQLKFRDTYVKNQLLFITSSGWTLKIILI